MKIAACPLLEERTEGEILLCDTVSCEACPLLDHLLQVEGPVEMVCSGCLLKGDRVLGFHSTGICDRCDEPRLILMPCGL